MAVPKTLGIETEYGIAHRGVVDPNPVSASSLLINAYLATHGYKAEADSSLISWDFIDESPELDARGLHSADAMPPVVETHLINAVLANGARYYVDHAHPEMSTPECADPLQAVLYDRAGELITQQSMAAANQRQGPTRSPRKAMANSIAKTGLRKLIAVASANGIKEIAVNMQVTPNPPIQVRIRCSRQWGRPI